MYGLYLPQIQFAGQHHDIGKLGVEPQCLYVGNAQLGGNMHLQADFSAI